MEPTHRVRHAVPAARARELLATGTPQEVLARIVPEDPLELRAGVAARLSERAFLCDAERVLLRAQVLCAVRAERWRGDPAPALWLAERVEEALAAVLAEEGAALEQGRVEPLALFAGPLALDPRALGVACAYFNRLPFEQREAFFALVLDAAADRLARARGLSLSELARRARPALELFRGVPVAAPRATPDPAGA